MTFSGGVNSSDPGVFKLPDSIASSSNSRSLQSRKWSSQRGHKIMVRLTKMEKEFYICSRLKKTRKLERNKPVLFRIQATVQMIKGEKTDCKYS